MGKHVNSFEEFSKMNESLSTKDAKQTIKDIFDKFDGIVEDEYLKNMWEKDSTLRNLYGKDLFDKAWDELIDDGSIETDDGKEWCWCSKKKKDEEPEEKKTKKPKSDDDTKKLSNKQRYRSKDKDEYEDVE